MPESEWSDPQSDLTEELGLASLPAVPQSNPSSFCTNFVVPRVQPSQLNRSDQRVPEYWDQTVPVWQAGGASKRKAAGSNGRGLQGRSARRLEGGGDATAVENSEEDCCCSSGRDGSNHSGRGDEGATANPSDVNFDAILSMTFCSSRHSGPRALMGEAHDEVESVRRLRVAIERTSICDPDSATCQNSHCGAIRLRNANAIRRRSCDFQNCRDPRNQGVRTTQF